MKDFSNKLFLETSLLLDQANADRTYSLESIESSVAIANQAIDKLRDRFVKIDHEPDAEMEFFRDIKPQFMVLFIYYHQLFLLRLNIPFGNKGTVIRYYKKFVEKLRRDANLHFDFYKYYRNGLRHCDENYFLRGNADLRTVPLPNYFVRDISFSTSHDFLLAWLLSVEKIEQFVREEISALENQETIRTGRIPAIKWTGSKVALTELAYAIHASGMLNNGDCGIGEIAMFFQSVFSIDIGHFHKTFLEMRQRKEDRTKFLNLLKDRLISRMEDADER